MLGAVRSAGAPHGNGAPRSVARLAAPLVDAILGGVLLEADHAVDPIFGLDFPRTCPGVPPEILDPRRAWSNPADYDVQAVRLAQRFVSNFARFQNVEPAIREAGPRKIEA